MRPVNAEARGPARNTSLPFLSLSFITFVRESFLWAHHQCSNGYTGRLDRFGRLPRTALVWEHREFVLSKDIELRSE